MRVALHFCDDSERARNKRIQEGKKYVDCKSRQEILDYFSLNVISLDVISESIDLIGQQDKIV